MTRSPVNEIRFGLVKVSIWKNQRRGNDMYTVTVCRLFKDGELWKESTRFGRRDLLVLAKALDAAHTWIYQQSQSDSE